MTEEESTAEFDEDFGYSLRPPDVERLLARARATGDRDVRLLAKQHQMLRRAAADLLQDLEAQGIVQPEPPTGSDSPTTYPIGFLRFILRDEPRRPA